MSWWTVIPVGMVQINDWRNTLWTVFMYANFKLIWAGITWLSWLLILMLELTILLCWFHTDRTRLQKLWKRVWMILRAAQLPRSQILWIRLHQALWINVTKSAPGLSKSVPRKKLTIWNMWTWHLMFQLRVVKM